MMACKKGFSSPLRCGIRTFVWQETNIHIVSTCPWLGTMRGLRARRLTLPAHRERWLRALRNARREDEMRRPDARGSMEEGGLAEEVEGGEGETIRQRRITHMLCARDETMKGLRGSAWIWEGVYLVRGTQLACQADVFKYWEKFLL